MTDSPADSSEPPPGSSPPAAPPSSLAPPAPPRQAAVPTAFRLALTKVTSFVLLTQQRRIVYSGSLEQLEQRYREVTAHNLMLGWWGIPFGLIFTPLALWRNRAARQKLRALASGSV